MATGGTTYAVDNGSAEYSRLDTVTVLVLVVSCIGYGLEALAGLILLFFVLQIRQWEVHLSMHRWTRLGGPGVKVQITWTE